MRKIYPLLALTIFSSLALTSCSFGSGDEKVESNSVKASSTPTAEKSLTMQSDISDQEQSKQDDLLKTQTGEIKETLLPNAYADVTVKPAITAGEIEIGKGHTALVVIKAGSAGKFELEGYFAKDFPKQDYISIAIPMDKAGSFQASFTPTSGEKTVVATLIVK